MKKTTLLTGMLLYSLISCDSSPVVQTKLPNTTDPGTAASAKKPQMEEQTVLHSEILLQASPQISRASRITDEDLALIKLRSVPMEDTIGIDFESIHNGNYHTIPDHFFEKYIYQLPVKASFEETIPKEEYEQTYFHTYRETPDYLLFTIIQPNSYCCIMHYGITVSKTDNTILDAALLALSGADGGWYRTDFGYWSNDSILVISTVDSEYEDLEDGDTRLVKDSIQQHLLLTNKGIWSKARLDSLRIIDTLYYTD